MPVLVRWQQHKTIIREAARLARNAAMIEPNRPLFLDTQMLSTISRAVWFNDVKIAKLLLALYPVAREHIVVCNGVVSLSNPALFSSTVSASKYAYREKARLEAEAAMKTAKKNKKKAKSQAEAMTRLSKLWSPFDSRLQLVGVRVKEGNSYRVITDPEAKIEELRQGWAPTFARRAVDSSVAKSVLDKWAGTFNWSEALPPDSDSFQYMIDHCGDAAPGPDGIPKAGWRATRGWGATTLHSLGMLLTIGVLPPISYNDGHQVFITKGEDEEDDKLVSRFPSETRPLTLKNDDNKGSVLAAAWVCPCSSAGG